MDLFAKWSCHHSWGLSLPFILWTYANPSTQKSVLKAATQSTVSDSEGHFSKHIMDVPSKVIGTGDYPAIPVVLVLVFTMEDTALPNDTLAFFPK